MKFWAPACVTSTTSVSIRIAFHESKKFLMAPWGDCAVTTLRTWECWEFRARCLVVWIPRLDLTSGTHSESSLACAGTADLTSRHGWRWVVQVNQFQCDRFLPFPLIFFATKGDLLPSLQSLEQASCSQSENLHSGGGKRKLWIMAWADIIIHHQEKYVSKSGIWICICGVCRSNKN